MEIKNLKDTPISEIVNCLSASFTNYFVSLPTDVDYWQRRFKVARVNLEFSYGCFEQGKLIGFIINGVDNLLGRRIAFNAGTGVTEESRGKQITDKLYAYALPYLKEQGISLCMLEVIAQNEMAQHVYERIGFSKTRKLLCFQGKILTSEQEQQGSIQETSIDELREEMTKNGQHYSWENSIHAIEQDPSAYSYYKMIGKGNKDMGYFVLYPARAILMQAESYTDHQEDWMMLLQGISSLSPSIKINNVSDNRTTFLHALTQAGLENYINQYEMEMEVQ